MATKKKKQPTASPDLATFGGLLLAVGGIVGGLILEKGQIRDIAQITAALIVLGGSIGAVCVSTPVPVLKAAFRKLRLVFFAPHVTADKVIEEILVYAGKARKSGIVSLEADAEDIDDPFFKKALTLAVDGADLQEIRKMLELEITLEEHRIEAEARVFEAAGGYAPTIGIIGAVLGLIQVMKHLSDMTEVGRGIAVAFVATVYGVGSANVFFLPAAAKIKARSMQLLQLKELTLEGVLSIVEGLNPKLVRVKLEAYARGHAPQPKPKRANSGAAAPAGSAAPPPKTASPKAPTKVA